jgi:hypothetical protein
VPFAYHLHIGSTRNHPGLGPIIRDCQPPRTLAASHQTSTLQVHYDCTTESQSLRQLHCDAVPQFHCDAVELRKAPFQWRPRRGFPLRLSKNGLSNSTMTRANCSDHDAVGEMLQMVFIDTPSKKGLFPADMRRFGCHVPEPWQRFSSCCHVPEPES